MCLWRHEFRLLTCRSSFSFLKAFEHNLLKLRYVSKHETTFFFGKTRSNNLWYSSLIKEMGPLFKKKSNRFNPHTYTLTHTHTLVFSLHLILFNRSFVHFIWFSSYFFFCVCVPFYIYFKWLKWMKNIIKIAYFSFFFLCFSLVSFNKRITNWFLSSKLHYLNSNFQMP